MNATLRQRMDQVLHPASADPTVISSDLEITARREVNTVVKSLVAQLHARTGFNPDDPAVSGPPSPAPSPSSRRGSTLSTVALTTAQLGVGPLQLRRQFSSRRSIM